MQNLFVRNESAGGPTRPDAVQEIRIPEQQVQPAQGGPHRSPNLLIAGVTHAGAGRLAKVLGRHPDICRAASDRIDLYEPYRYGRPVEPDLREYERLFAECETETIRLESTPTYLDAGLKLAERLDEDLPGLLVLVVLKDPIERLWAGYRSKSATGRLPAAMTFQKYVEHSLSLRSAGLDTFEANRYFRTLSGGMYAEQLSGWQSVFGARMRVLFSEQLLADPVEEVRSVYRWLGLDPQSERVGDWAPVDEDLRSGAGLEHFERSAGRRAGSLLAGLPWRRGGIVAPGTAQPARPRTHADGIYERANLDLAALLTQWGYTRLPGWLGGSDPAA